MARSRYERVLSAAVVEAARVAVGKQLPRHLPAMQEPSPEIRQLIARLVALDSVKRRAGEGRADAVLPLEPLPPHARPLRS
jgi:hypothetical protein